MTDVLDSKYGFIDGGYNRSNKSSYLEGVPLRDNKPVYLSGSSLAIVTQLVVEVAAQPHTNARVTQVVVEAAVDVLYSTSSLKHGYLDGNPPVASSSKYSFCSGTQDGISNKSAYISGQDNTSDNALSYIYGEETASNSKSAFLQAPAEIEVSDSKTGYLDGGSITLAVDFVELEVQAQPVDHISVYTAGLDSTLGNHSAYLYGSDSYLSSKTAFILGSDNSQSGNDAHLSGQDNTSNSKSAYILGLDDTSQDSASAYTGGSDYSVDSKTAYSSGSIGTTEHVSGYLSGTDIGTSSAYAYLRGSSDTSGNKSAYTNASSVEETSSKSAHLAGSDSSISNKSAYINSGTEATDNRDGYIHGEVSTSSNKPAHIVSEGIPTSHIGAYTRGVKATFPTTATTNSDSGYLQDVALITNSIGIVYYVYITSGGSLAIRKYLEGVPGTITIQTRTDLDMVGYSLYHASATIDTQDCMHVIVAASAVGAAKNNAYRIFDTKNDTWLGSWEEFDNDSSNVAATMHIATDSNDKPHIVYHKLKSGITQIYYIERTGSSWTTPLQISTNDSIAYYSPRILIKDNNDIEVAAKNRTNSDLYYWQYNGSWSEYSYTGTYENSYPPGLILDKDDNVIRASPVDIGTYSVIYENGTSTGVQLNDVASILTTTLVGNYKVHAYRGEDGNIWISWYINSEWTNAQLTTGGNRQRPVMEYHNFASNQVPPIIGIVVTSTTDDQYSYYYEIEAYIRSIKSAYMRGETTASSSKSSFTDGILRSSSSAFTEGYSTNPESYQKAYLCGGVSSNKPAFIYGDPRSNIDAYINGVGGSSDINPAFMSGSANVSTSGEVYLSGVILNQGSISCYTSGTTISNASQPAYLSGIVQSSKHAYMNGVIVPRAYAVINGKKYDVLSENYVEKLVRANEINKTMQAGIDIAVGSIYRQWSIVIATTNGTPDAGYGNIDDIENLYQLVSVALIDHYQQDHIVYPIGEFKKLLLTVDINGLSRLNGLIEFLEIL